MPDNEKSITLYFTENACGIRFPREKPHRASCTLQQRGAGRVPKFWRPSALSLGAGALSTMRG